MEYYLQFCSEIRALSASEEFSLFISLENVTVNALP